MAEQNRYTRADVLARDGKNGAPLWIILRDIVYDVTQYVHEHPGGGDPIWECAGKESTRDFDDAGHTKDAYDMLVKYRIGEIVEEEKQYDANGKKLKKKGAKTVNVDPEKQNTSRSFCSLITCGLIG